MLRCQHSIRCGTLATMAAKKTSKNKPGPWDDIARGVSISGKVVYEASGAADAVRFAKNPSLRNAANLGVSVAAYALGPAAKAAQAAKAAKAATAVRAGMGARVASNVAKAATSQRVVKAYKGAGTVTTKSGKALSMTGVKSFATGKNPARVAASTRAAVSAEARAAGAAASAKAGKNVTRAKVAGGAIVGAKGGATAERERNKGRNKKK